MSVEQAVGSDNWIGQQTTQVQEPGEAGARLKITLPSGRVFRSGPMRPEDLKGGVFIQWFEAVRGQISSDESRKQQEQEAAKTRRLAQDSPSTAAHGLYGREEVPTPKVEEKAPDSGPAASYGHTPEALAQQSLEFYRGEVEGFLQAQEQVTSRLQVAEQKYLQWKQVCETLGLSTDPEAEDEQECREDSPRVSNDETSLPPEAEGDSPGAGRGLLRCK